MCRIAYEQKLRRALERHFPKFKITRLTRQEAQSSIDASLTVAVLWLDVCRKAQAPNVLVSSIIGKRGFLNICRSKHLSIIGAAGAHHRRLV
jgi:hypothetical protein